jgi:hypothetical protein
MSGWGNETMPRGKDDRRSQTGHRVLFDKETQQEAWTAARGLKRLTPMHARWVRLLVDALLVEQAYAEADVADRQEAAH